MAIEQKKAKGTKPAKRKLDPEMEELRKPERGKKKHQQLKAYMVLECLMRETNEKKPLSARDIVAYLDDFGISAEATSVRNDIKEINYVMYMLEYGCTIDIAIEELDSGDYEEDKFIKYSQKKKGYYISRNRDNITENDVRLIAECIYASRFITEKQADHLVDIACNLINARAAERIKNTIRVSKEQKVVSSDVFYKVSTILEALSEGTVDSPHAPEKITFSYQEYVIDDVKKTAIKQNYSYHKVSPDGIINVKDCYYLVARNEKQTIRAFEIDLMNDIRLTGEMKDGESVSYLTKKNVSYPKKSPVKPVKVVLLCANRILDQIIPVFGTGEDVEYSTYDGSCFLLTKSVVPDNEFFRLLIDFYDSIKILEPDSLVEEYFHFLERPKQIYSSDVPKMSLYPKHKRTFIDPKRFLELHTNNQTTLELLELIQELKKYYDDSEIPSFIKLERVLKKESEYFKKESEYYSGPKGAERIKELERRIEKYNESLKDQKV